MYRWLQVGKSYRQRLVCLSLVCVAAVISVSYASGQSRTAGESKQCLDSDRVIEAKENILKCSLGSVPGVNCSQYNAQEDWPNQAIYMNNLLRAIAEPNTCLNTSIAREALEYLDTTNVSKSNWWYTWIVFQVQYYDMPRKPGARIESPATLGRKCWAFAYLAQIWPGLKPRLVSAIHGKGISLNNFFKAYETAIPLTMTLCEKVTANCFVNETYNPKKRNGTCPDRVGQFYTGFAWENGNNNYQWRNDSVDFPFPRYSQTDQWRDNVMFAVNTALNYII